MNNENNNSTSKICERQRYVIRTIIKAIIKETRSIFDNNDNDNNSDNNN